MTGKGQTRCILYVQEPVLAPEVASAIDLAFANIHKFHKAQMPDKPLVVEVWPAFSSTNLYGMRFYHGGSESNASDK